MANGQAQPKSKSTSSAVAEAVQAVDVSIPYDAAARLAFADWNGGTKDEATYQKFQDIYVTKTVALVTAKKAARDAALEAQRLASIAAQADKDMAALV
jgi:hypothetical protein